MSFYLQRSNTLPKLFDDSLFGNVFWPFEQARRAETLRSLGAVDIEEDEARVTIRMDLPGVPKEDVKISYERGLLSISAERKTQTCSDASRCHARERFTGQIERSFTLGEKLDSDSVAAKLENGVLEITLNKRPDVQPKTISIN